MQAAICGLSLTPSGLGIHIKTWSKPLAPGGYSPLNSAAYRSPMTSHSVKARCRRRSRSCQYRPPGAVRRRILNGVTTFEHATLTIAPGREHDFERAVAAVAEVFSRAAARSVRLGRCVEVPGRYALVVEWESVEAHAAFRDSALFPEWRGAVSDFFTEPPRVEHYHSVDLT